MTSTVPDEIQVKYRLRSLNISVSGQPTETMTENIINIQRELKKKTKHKKTQSLVITSNKKDCERALTALHILRGPKAG